MNYLMNHTGRADVYCNKTNPHVEYVRGNYWLSTVNYSLQATCVQSGRTTTTMQEESKHKHKKENKMKWATSSVKKALLKA